MVDIQDGLREGVFKGLMDSLEQFETDKRSRVAGLADDSELRRQSREWMAASAPHGYTYNFEWLGVPVIQFPQDLVALQEVIWRTRPDWIVETGVAHGGSLVFSASMLELLGGEGKVLGIDIDIREHNRKRLEAHPLFHRIELIEGNAASDDVAARATGMVNGRVLVILDSNHTHKHVLRELQLYSPLVKADGYLVVFDTSIEEAPDELFNDKPWGRGNNPMTAVREFLEGNPRFEVDTDIEARLQITVAPSGWLRCVAD